MTTNVIDKIISDGQLLADKITKAKTINELEALSTELDEYSEKANDNFGIIDEFSEQLDEKYCDLTFYLYMAREEKEDHLEYYASHPDVISDGVLDFLHYLHSKEWVNTKNTKS